MELGAPTAGGPVEPTTLSPPTPAGTPAAPADDGVGFNPLVLICFLAILVGVCVQNWVLARRAEGRPLVPEWLQRGPRGGSER